jgi:hypothetical protein
VVNCPLTLLENSFKEWDLAVSSEERITKMEEFISIASLTLEGRDDSAELMCSMLKVVIPTLVLAKGHRLRVMTMQSKMDELNIAHSIDRVQLRSLGLLKNGLELRLRAIESRFGIWYMSWILRVRLVVTPNFRSTVTGSSLSSLPSMSTHRGLRSLEETLTGEMTGYNSLVLDWENHF